MLHEKPNKSFHWKNKLDELDHLPDGPVPDKTASWEKLHARLQENAPIKRIIWYWAAAAVLLVALTIQWFMMNQKDNKIVNIHGQQKPKQETTVNVSVIENKKIIINDSPMVLKTKKTIGVKVRNKTADLKLSKTVISDEAIIAETNTTRLIKEVTNNSIKPVDTISFALPIQTKKKLRVVHINELDKTVEEDIQFARNSVGAGFYAKPFHQDVFSGFGITRNASDNIIKIKLSPSN